MSILDSDFKYIQISYKLDKESISLHLHFGSVR